MQEFIHNPVIFVEPGRCHFLIIYSIYFVNWEFTNISQIRPFIRLGSINPVSVSVGVTVGNVRLCWERGSNIMRLDTIANSDGILYNIPWRCLEQNTGNGCLASCFQVNSYYKLLKCKRSCVIELQTEVMIRLFIQEIIFLLEQPV